MHTELHQQIRSAGDNLVKWIANYDANGRTYRQFWADHSVAAGEFDALTQRAELDDELSDLVFTVRDFPILLGYEPDARAEKPALDDLIIGKQRGAGETP